ncbi:MAG: YigZ family protein [Bacteroidales bacterium]|nr:YigZ family protein [Bacteroidales bacterium]
MKDLYLTIQGPSEGIYKEKGSKFLAFAYPLDHEEGIKQQLAGLKKMYHDARHHCFAWRLGPGLTRYRVSDDGEPSGSAGKPIYGQIISRELSDLLVVVVRYFGGTKLGVGGLINAYRSAAADALDQNSCIERRVYDRLRVEFKYDCMNAVMKVIKELELDIEEQEFDLNCSLTLKSWKRHSNRVFDSFSKITSCRIALIEE